ncbi:MAG: MBL fold metallo-hydrolase [Candidatus Saccharibacteria bacterium]
MQTGSFTVHRIKGYICNIFLLEYEDRLLLLDSGAINDVKRIEEYCRTTLGRTPKDIKLAVVSHMHPDHGGGACILRKNYGIPVAAHQDVDLWYAGIGGYVQHKLDCFMATEVAYKTRHKLERILYRRKIKPDFPLQDGDRLPGFEDWSVIHVPGHTMHDIALYNSKEKLLYSADCICDIGEGRLVLPIPIMFPDKMDDSFDKLAKLDASTLLLAHGEPIEFEDNPRVFEYMKGLLKEPPTTIMRRAHWMSIYSPEIWKHGSRKHICHY